MTDSPKRLFRYWMTEREAIRAKKEAGFPKPWSDDPIFQRTYFTNVHREDDRVTKYIREWLKPAHPKVRIPAMIARFINKPETLGWISPMDHPRRIASIMRTLEKPWGGAYIVSTCGQKIDKITYFEELMYEWYSLLNHVDLSTCEDAHFGLLQYRGLSDFMAAQVVADLKHHPGHELNSAPDFYTFAKPGPGSLRGLAWYFQLDRVTKGEFYSLIKRAHKEQELPEDFEMQDLQNCFCEFDKYMRIKAGTGRSKRSYPGI